MKNLMKKTAVALVLSASAFAANAEGLGCKRNLFSGVDGAYFTAANVGALADYSTTLTQVSQFWEDGSRRYREVGFGTAKAIGEFPSAGRIQKWFAGRLLINAAVQCWMPDGLNRLVLGTTAVMGVGQALVNHYHVGAKFSDSTEVLLGVGGMVMLNYKFTW